MKRFKNPAEIKVGVIGYGGAFNMGRGHLNEMQAAGMTPAAVADPDKARLKVAQEEFPGIETYESVTDMLDSSGVNLVTIITPHNTHAEIAIECADAGKHVVCEKPFAITTEECDEMIAAAEKSGVVLSTYHNRHWDGCILQALKMVSKGKIGDVVRVEAHMGAWGKPRNWWRSSKSISGGILYDWGVHLLEYTLQIVDSEIEEVTGFAKQGFWAPKTAWKDDANEDEGLAIIRYANGMWSSLSISTIDSNPKKGMMEITGTKGSYVFDGKSWEMITHSGKDKVIRQGENPPSLWKAYYQNVANHLTKGEKLVITPEWARRPIHILDLADKSAREGRSFQSEYK
jgi:predicted dehydrogenase